MKISLVISGYCAKPISFLIIFPQYEAAGYNICPIFSNPKVTVISALTADPITTPVDALIPDGMSTATTSLFPLLSLFCVYCERTDVLHLLIVSTTILASPASSLDKPLPNKASTITPYLEKSGLLIHSMPRFFIMFNCISNSLVEACELIIYTSTL